MLLPSEIWDLPEFVALCTKLGINREIPTSKLTIIIPIEEDESVKIIQEYNAQSGSSKLVRRETTNENNKQYRTFSHGIDAD